MKLITLKHILYVTAFVAGGFMMTSCQDKGFDWDKAHAQKINDKTEAAFAEAFEQIFGKIDPNQSWDFTVDNTKAATRAEAERKAATATEYTKYCKVGGYYDVPDNFKTWLDVNMYEGVDNRAKGTALNFTMPSDGKFDLIPMYQGEAVSSWEMHMIVTPKDGTAPIDMKFWKRNDNIEIKQKPLTWSDAAMRIKNDKCSKYLYVNPDGTNSNEFVYPATGANGVSIINPVQEFVHERQWDGSFNPYTKTNEYGFRFTVVIIKEKKYLYAFTDDPANEGGFISTNSKNKVIFVKYSDFGNKDNDGNVQPRELTYYNEPFCNKEATKNDVQFLMIGTKVIYVDNDGNLAAQELKSLRDETKYTGTKENDRIWYLEDAKREDMMNPENGYTWTFEVDVDINNSKRHTRELYRIGCNGDGTVNQSDKITSIYKDFGDTKEDWMNVKYTIRENSMNRTAVRGKRYQFDFTDDDGKVIDRFKDASISFYWETMIPWSRRSDVNGRYLYSDKPGQLQMLAITARQAPADGNKNVVAVGCEAGMAHIHTTLGYSYNDTDWDYNDVVFLLSSEKPITYIDRDGDDEIIQKRYMVEDLGSTDDIDFNDMVVDVIQTTPMTITETTQDGKVTSTTITPGTPSQKVIVRAVGGTLPFDFIIVEGGKETKVFSKSDLLSKSSVNVNGMYNTGCVDGSTSADNNNGIGSVNSHIDYDKNYGEFTIDDNVWDYNNNNVMFRVYKKISDGVIDAYHTHDIKFPVTGETPHIIAFPVDKLWRNERRLCCWDWINDIEPALWEEPENSRKEDGSTHVTNFSKWIETNNNRTDYLNWVESKFSQGARNKIEQWLNVQYPVSGNK